MPTKNVSLTIGKALASLVAQDYPKNRIQVVFVDGLSTDGTYQKLIRWAKKNRGAYQDVSVFAEKSNIPKARNICLNAAKGDYILFWDADVVAPPTAVRTLLDHLKNRNVGVANYLYLPPKLGIIDKVLGLEEIKEIGYARTAVMGFTMIRKKVVAEVGQFNEKLDGFEDQEFCRRVAKSNFRILTDPSFKLVHIKKPTSFRRFVKDNFTRRSKYVAMLIKTGSKRHLLRILYYILLPLGFVVGAISIPLFGWKVGCEILIMAAFYMSLSIIWHLRMIRRKASYGLLSPFIYLVGGVSLAYGLLWNSLR
jgi:glycosyltransferase involved in cell wall biosynthesis